MPLGKTHAAADSGRHHRQAAMSQARGGREVSDGTDKGRTGGRSGQPGQSDQAEPSRAGDPGEISKYRPVAHGGDLLQVMVASFLNASPLTPLGDDVASLSVMTTVLLGTRRTALLIEHD
jgi:hypothetical protein